jgi:putative FmdB family regulatory protein
MPMFDYSCPKCSHAFEHLHKTSSEPAPRCPKCGGPVVKLLSTVSVGASSGSDRSAFESMPRRGPGACGRCGDPRGSCDL